MSVVEGSADPTAVQNKPQGPPGPGSPGYHGSTSLDKGAALKRGGPGPNSPMSSELAQLMQEPAGGHNHGRRASEDPQGDGGRHTPLSVEGEQAREFAREGGWTMIVHVPGTERRGGHWQAAGGTTHRGVLHPDEYVDQGALQAMVEHELGFTYEQVRSVYRQGPLKADQRELRGRIDARLLALSRAGANVALLGAALGFPIKDNGNCRAMENALARARKEDD